MVYSYAHTVVNQVDEQYKGKRTNWSNPMNASLHDGTTHTRAEYTKSGSTIKKPNVLAIYDFEEINIPENAIVTNMWFEVRMAGSSNIKAPHGVYLNYLTNTKDTISNNNSTGFRSHAYHYEPNKKLTSAYDTIKYPISQANFKILMGDNSQKISTLTGERFGILLIPHDATSTGYIKINWVKLVVEYEMPSTYLTYTNVSIDADNPTNIYNGEVTRINVEFGNRSIIDIPNQTINVDLPYGFEVVNYGIGDKSISINADTWEWVVSGKAKTKNTLYVDIVPHSINAKTISAGNDYLGYNEGYFYVLGYDVGDYSEGYIEYSTLQQGERSCVVGHMTWTSQDDTANVFLQLGSDTLQENDILSVEVYSNDEDVYLNNWSLQNNKVLFNIHVPAQSDVDISVNVCYLPRQSGYITLAIPSTSTEALVLDPITKRVKFNTDNDGNCTNIWQLDTTRFATQIDTDLTVIPIGMDSFNKDLYIEPTTLSLDQWKKRRYIGCVETEHSHFNPKSTFEDDLLNEHYKNMQYVGKANEYDEDISLDIRLRPHQVPTIQGLIKIDKPIPINLVPSAFEGDPLNHRGWVEITKIEAEKTNPLWYKCQIDVKYITHNIISRFNISRGKSVNDYELPSVYNTSLFGGDDIGEFFNVDTDGAYVFDEEEEVDTHRNLFSINNGQNVVLTSKKPLSSKCDIDFYWDTMLFPELRENNISRTIQLIDEYDNVIFEYEYCDFDFTDDVYSCYIIGRSSKEDAPIINTEVYIHSDVEYTTDEDDEEYDDEDLNIYGSQVKFTLDSNKLSVRELGFSGVEHEKENILLEEGSYYLRVEFKNNNSDADTGNILSWLDFTINELAYDSAIAQYYNKLVVSPYPIPNKQIVFTRTSEEGTIYYLNDDGGDFDFLLEPFYQYLCGVDLRTDDGIQVFDFNNSYGVIYLVNGLIRFGINRINGDLYLDKYDFESNRYIRTNRFRITKFDDVEVVSIDEDMITLQISDVYITMWRGRPYVALSHETEDIQMLDTFNMVFGDGINTETYSYPQYWNLVNSKNKLPECIGGTNLIKSSCIELETDESELNDVGEFTIIPNKTQGYVGEDIILNITNLDVIDGEVSLIVDGDVVATNHGKQATAQLSEEGLKEIYAIYHGNDENDMAISNIVNVVVEEGNDETQQGHHYTFRPITWNGGYTYNDQNHIFFQLLDNDVGVQGVAVEVYTPHQTWHMTTDATGETYGINNQIIAGTHTIRATAIDYDLGIDLVASQKITVKKSTPTIKGIDISVKKGNKAKFRLLDDVGNPITGASVSVTIGGKKYARVSSSQGDILVKMSTKGTIKAKVKFAGEKNKYNSVSKTFNVEVK